MTTCSWRMKTKQQEIKGLLVPNFPHLNADINSHPQQQCWSYRIQQVDHCWKERQMPFPVREVGQKLNDGAENNDQTHALTSNNLFAKNAWNGEIFSWIVQICCRASSKPGSGHCHNWFAERQLPKNLKIFTASEGLPAMKSLTTMKSRVLQLRNLFTQWGDKTLHAGR